MNQQDFNCSIHVDISPTEAFMAITRVSEWWAKDVEGNSEDLNSIFTVRFGETFVTFKIVKWVAGKKMAWQVTDCNLHWIKDKKEWKDTRINWEVFSKSNETQINFTHIGLVPEIECFKDCSKGWNFYVRDSLFKLITEGKGLPEGRKNS